MKKKSHFSILSALQVRFCGIFKLIPSAFTLGIFIGILTVPTICFLTGRFLGTGRSKDILLVQVDGNSMLPSLWGGTIFETCPKCRMHAPRANQGTSICPNCGWMVHEKIRSSKSYLQECRQEIRFDDLLEVVPQEKYEFDDVVVATPNKKIGPVVKRIAGVPGDRLEVQNGVLYRNGKRAVHSLETWKQMRILVFSDDFRPDGVSRWTPIGSSVSSSISETLPNDIFRGKNSESVSRFPRVQTELPRKLNARFPRQNESLPSYSHSVSVPGIDCLPDGWRFHSAAPCGIKYVHQTGRFVPSSDGRIFCRLEPAPLTNYRAENGTQFPAHSIGMIHELLCAFETTWIKINGNSHNFHLIVSLPTLVGRQIFVLAAKSEMRGNSELKTEFQKTFASNPAFFTSYAEEAWPDNQQKIDVSFFRMEKEIPEGTACSLLFSTLDGIPRLTADDAPLREFLTFSLPPFSDVCSHSTTAVVSDPSFSITQSSFSPLLPAQLPAEKSSAHAIAEIWSPGNQTIEIRRLQLFRGEYWEKNLTKFHKIAQNGEKTLAFDCESEYYLIGDNFFVSEDSRRWGTISRTQIHGKVVLPDRTDLKTKRNAVSNFNIPTPCSFD